MNPHPVKKPSEDFERPLQPLGVGGFNRAVAHVEERIPA